MEGWEVRQHRHTLIRFVQRTWRVAGRTTSAGKTHYQLVPWTPADPHLIGREIDYNAEYVAQRDRTAVSTRKRSRATGLLRLVSPFIGFLPGQVKIRLEAAYGVDPVATTFQSVFLEFLIMLGAFAMSSIGQLILAHEGAERAKRAGIPVVLYVVIGVIAGLDCAVRYDRILGEVRPPPGFYEWLWGRKKKLGN
jgi:hypothetical protein